MIALLPYPKLDPYIIHIGDYGVRWYGMAYLVGLFLAYLLLLRMSRRGLFRVPPNLVGDLVTWLAFGVFIGGRAGWWIFYHRAPVGRLEPWWEPFAVVRGGMSFHGGLLGVLVALLLWIRKHKVSFAHVADCCALVTPIGLFFGRIANFINGELVGRPTSLPWAMIFPDHAEPRHPSQLYEALLEGPVLMGMLWLVFRKWRPRDGGMALLFVALYSIFRFAVEFTREPDSQLGFIVGHLTMGQLLSIAIAVAAGIMWMIWMRRPAAPLPAPPPKPQSPPARKQDRRAGRK